ncbi:NAD(P)-binding domain-containing protein [Azotobacter chroococcum]|uniref:Putative flavoprotein involved in K+ transport n=1 Tax=Azotobacter chroococcum TaxID=353 RepID=A0A4R1PN31_9GAMM|nr:NAD(P)-binding domain-containing protein [Azotobacter chroococcum]TBV90435.1 FAD-dependent oxidoreductase [Azotobacter chroococcum]TCL32077.1 putative flavoprotein involved in K+ transport [Azotobacter chroococcum]
MSEHFDTLIVGGGQGGLSTSYYLTLQQRSHLVLERGDIPAPVWRDDRWDAFTLVTPNWDFRLPGATYAGDDPDGFMPREEIVRTFADYVQRHQLPVKFNCEVTEICADPAGFRVSTRDGDYTARNVVVATGLFQFPRRHAMAAGLSPSIVQMHSGAYRNPAALAPGAVLVVGSSQSGCQIADELNRAGRTVYLCVGRHDRAPRRYRGKDIFEWMRLSGLADQTVDSLPSPKLRFAPNPIMAGRREGGSLNVHRLARNGVRLLGTLQGIDGTGLNLAPDLHDNLAGTDQREAELLGKIDMLVSMRKLDLPEEQPERLEDGYAAPLAERLDLAEAGVTTLIWATGYGFSFDLVRFPVFDEDGYPLQQRGATAQPGLYFVGLPWLYNKRSGLLSGVGEDAEHIAGHIQARDNGKG